MTIPDEVDIIVCGGGSCGCVEVDNMDNSDNADGDAVVWWLAVWPTWTTSSRSCSLRPERATSTTHGFSVLEFSRRT